MRTRTPINPPVLALLTLWALVWFGVGKALAAIVMR